MKSILPLGNPVFWIRPWFSQEILLDPSWRLAWMWLKRPQKNEISLGAQDPNRISIAQQQQQEVGMCVLLKVYFNQHFKEARRCHLVSSVVVVV
jgi:hypothetical protein